MKHKSRIKTEERLDDLDPSHIENEKEREKALEALNVDIIVRATPEEFMKQLKVLKRNNKNIPVKVINTLLSTP